MAYAQNTEVPSDRSRAEIEKILQRYGADDFAYATNRERAMIAFAVHDRNIRFTVPLPDRNSREFTMTPTGKFQRTAAEAEKAYEQAVRQKWRALALMVKAKLEAVESGIVTFEQEFMPHIVLPGGATVYETAAPAIDQAYADRSSQPFLHALERGR